jgi:uncharacterized protein YcaQ
MPKVNLPPPSMTLTRRHARRFLLAHQRLWPPRQLRGTSGILEFIRHVGCIQFDPVNVVGRNPDLVLQSRVTQYKPAMLEKLLYDDRKLLDGWDKMSSIHLATDWPYFSRHRAYMREQHGDPSSPPMEIAPLILQTIREHGPLSSIDFKHHDMVDWSWGRPSRLTRASLDVLYVMGEVLIHHRVGTRRVFDLTERLLPAELISSLDPNETDTEYQYWHVFRRVGGLGLARPSASEYWGAILGVKTEIRHTTLKRLVERGDLIVLAVEGVPRQIFFMRKADLPVLEAVQNKRSPKKKVAFIGPLDNFLWDRNLLRLIFDFEYAWEIYKPAVERKYGYYVLPVIFGDRFVGRVDPIFDRKRRTLTLTNWWWEEGVQPDEPMYTALIVGLRDFMKYLGAERVLLGRKISTDKTMRWVRNVGLD